MAEAVALAGFRVNGIYTAPLIERLQNGTYTSEEALLAAVKEEVSTREDRKQARLARREARQEQKLEEKYLKIRDKLIAAAFKTTQDEIKRRKGKLADLQNAHDAVIGTGNPLSESTNSLDITEGVYNGAVGTTRADRKSSTRTFIKGMAGAGVTAAGLLAPSLIAKISAVTAALASNPILAGLGLAFTVGTVIYAFKKYLKRNKGNQSDEFAKGEALEKELEEYLGRIEAFSKSIDDDKEMIKSKIKTLKKKELKAFLDKYLDEKIKSFGLEKEDLQAGSIGEIFEEFKEEEEKTEKDETAEKTEEQDKKDKRKKQGTEEDPAVMGG